MDSSWTVRALRATLLDTSHTSSLVFNYFPSVFIYFTLPQTDPRASTATSGVRLARSTNRLFVKNKQVMLVELADLFMACPSPHAWLSRPYTANVTKASRSIAKSPAGCNTAWNIDMVPARCHTWHLIHSLRCSFLILSSQQGIKGKCQRSFVWYGGKTEPVFNTHFYALTHTEKERTRDFKLLGLVLRSQLNIAWNSPIFLFCFYKVHVFLLFTWYFSPTYPNHLNYIMSFSRHLYFLLHLDFYTEFTYFHVIFTPDYYYFLPPLFLFSGFISFHFYI